MNVADIGSIARFFPTTPGATYDLSFAYASNCAHRGESNRALAMTFVTDVAGVTLLVTPFLVFHGLPRASDLDWVVDRRQCTAVGTSTASARSRAIPLPADSCSTASWSRRATIPLPQRVEQRDEADEARSNRRPAAHLAVFASDTVPNADDH